jgi:hypothetical protein
MVSEDEPQLTLWNWFQISGDQIDLVPIIGWCINIPGLWLGRAQTHQVNANCSDFETRLVRCLPLYLCKGVGLKCTNFKSTKKARFVKNTAIYAQKTTNTNFRVNRHLLPHSGQIKMAENFDNEFDLRVEISWHWSQGSMLWSRFSAIFANFRWKNRWFSQKPML